MRYFLASDLTDEALDTLHRYDAEVRALLPEGYRWNIRARDWELLPILRDPPRAGSAVLDVGSFNTFLGTWLARSASSVYVTDLFTNCLKSNVLRRLGLWRRRPLEAPFERWYLAVKGAGRNIKIRQLDLTAIGFPDDTFDFISCISVIEHIPDYPKAVAELHRVLKPGGRLVITTDSSPAGEPYRRGAQTFSPTRLDELFSPYPVKSVGSEPDFSEANWCYRKDRPVVTAFVELGK